MSSEKRKDVKKSKKHKKDKPTIAKSDMDSDHVKSGRVKKKHEKPSKSTEDSDDEMEVEEPKQCQPVDLSSQMKADNDFFMSVINMIPPQFYFDEETNEDILEMRAAGKVDGKKKSQKALKRAHSSAEGGLSMKRARFDPSTNQTVQQMEAYCQHEAKKGSDRSRHPAELGAQAVEEIRERLHRRLEELKQQRTSMGKGVYKDEKQRLKRRESKLKRKMKLKMEKTYKTVPLTPKINGDFSKEKATKPIFNKEGKLVYSKFDFTDLSDKNKDKPKSEFTGKNYQKLLAKVEKRNEKLKKLKETDPERGEKMEESVKWQSALHRAEGLKVKDNPEMLKKALKSKEKKKQMKAKKWEARTDRTDKMKDEKQQKRHTNLKAQKQKSLERKVQKLKKKGRLVPGF